jgi:hypothetical protein
MRMPHVFALLAVVIALSACATSRVPADAQIVETLSPHTGYRSGTPLAREALPDGALIADGTKPLHLLAEIKDGRISELRPVAAQEANLTLAFVQQDRERSAIDIKSAVPLGLKLDLFVSRDGQTFAYISSCPVRSGGNAFAQWPHRVRAVAIANPRVPDGEVCD